METTIQPPNSVEVPSAPLELSKDELERKMREAAACLDGSRMAKVSLLSGLSPERIKKLGGV